MNKKITKATFKSFIKKNGDQLFIKVRASFDGQIDGLAWYKGDFMPAIKKEEFFEHTLNIKGVWLVGGGRDYFKSYEDENYIGIGVSNCCGYFQIAIKKSKIQQAAA